MINKKGLEEKEMTSHVSDFSVYYNKTKRVTTPTLVFALIQTFIFKSRVTD